MLGPEAAEEEADERLLSYYLKTETWTAVTDERRPLRVLVGNKGTGKSALFRVASWEDEANGRLAIITRPDDFAEVATSGTDRIALVKAWKHGLQAVIIEKVLRSLGDTDQGSLKRLRKTSGDLIDTLVKVIGNEQKGFQLDPAKVKLADAFLKRHELTVYLDDLDRGWTGQPAQVERLAAMFDAIRDLRSTKLRLRISLRTDVYALLRTDAASDKFETAVVLHAWSNHEVFVLLVKRIAAYLGEPIDDQHLLAASQSQLAHYLDPILERRFRGDGRWSNAPMYKVIMSFARRRPRDLVKLLTFAGREAHRSGRTVIQTADLKAVFPRFSEGRLQDVVNEFRAEVPELEAVLRAMKSTAKEKRTVDSYVLKTDDMLRKLNNVLQNVPARFANRQEMSPMALLAFLYRIDFLQARRDGPDGIQRFYFDQNRLVTPDKIDVGFQWEIQLAFRWVLQPDTPESIFTRVDAPEGENVA